MRLSNEQQPHAHIQLPSEHQEPRERESRLTIEHLKKQKNVCTREVLEKLMPDLLRSLNSQHISFYDAIVRGMAEFSGYHLSGGTPEEIHKRYFEDWLENPDHKKRYEDFIHFVDTEDEKGNFMRREKGFDDDDEPREPVTTFYHSNGGWFVYDTSRVNPDTGEQENKREEPHIYRIYFTFQQAHVTEGFQEVIERLMADPEMAAVGFQIKTQDLYYTVPGVNELSRRDNCILYLTQTGINLALPIVQKFAEERKDYLETQGIFFTQSLSGNDGKEIGGIGISSNKKIKTPDFVTLDGTVVRQDSLRIGSYNQIVAEGIKQAAFLLLELCKNSKVKHMLSVYCNDFSLVAQTALGKYNEQQFLKELLRTKDGKEFFLNVFSSMFNRKMNDMGFSEQNIAFDPSL